MKQNPLHRLAITVAMSMVVLSNLHGQHSTGLSGFTETIASKVLKETREINIRLPQTNTAVPLIIVLDGESLFAPVVSAVQFMNYSLELPLMPESIVVGIPNKDRNRDMPIPQMYGAGGEQIFLQFITDELIPYIKEKYKTNNQVILIGHSQGGLFASYAMAQRPLVYTMVMALDAPMNVDPKTNFIKQRLNDLLSNQSGTQWYATLESVYGWGKEWTTMANSKRAFRKEYPDESHESIPFKGIYDGLKNFYKTFPPPRRDMSLIAVLHYYEDISKGYGFWYDVPYPVLTSSARRKIQDNRKKEAQELLEFAKEKYGPTDQITNLLERTSKLPDQLDPQVEFYLNHSRPTAAEIKPFVGRWVGELVVRDGQNLPLDIQVGIENGKGKMTSVLPWPPHDKVNVEILLVKDGQLIWGRKNRGSGLVISESKLEKDGTLTGIENLIGFVFPDDMPEEIRERMKEIVAKPNTFKLNRK